MTIGKDELYIKQVLEEAGITIKDYKSLYEQVLKRPYYINELATGFKALTEAGATLQEHPFLYEKVIEKDPATARYADRLPTGFKALKEAGITLQEHPFLYEKVIVNAYFADKLTTGFKALTEAGATLQEHLFLYEKVIENAHNADKLPTGFKALKESGITLQEHLSLYNKVIQNAFYADNLPTGFKALTETGITLQEYPSLYEKVIENAYYADRLAPAFKILKEAGITLQEHPFLYEKVIEKANCADRLAPAFKILKEAGATLQKHPYLYEKVFEKAWSTNQVATVFKILKEMGLTISEEANYYELALQQLDNKSIGVCHLLKRLGFIAPDDKDMIKNSLNSSVYGLFLLEWLKRKGFTKESHLTIYEAFLKGDSALIHSPYAATKIKNLLEQYVASAPLLMVGSAGYAKQHDEIQQLIEEGFNAENRITQGPLYKSTETLALEAILKRLIQEGIEKVQLRFDSALGYMMQFGSEPEVYLSELLKRVNFEHLALSAEEVSSLGGLILSVHNSFYNEPPPDKKNSIVNKLPQAAQQALSYYVTTKYKNMNRLFRGVSQASESKYVWIDPVDGRDNLMVNFLAGCLVNWSAAELPRLLYQSEERYILEKIVLSQFLNIPKPAQRQMVLRQFLSVRDEIQRLKKNPDGYHGLLETALTHGHIHEDEYKKALSLFDKLDIFFPNYRIADRGEHLTPSETMDELEVQKRRLANIQFSTSVVSFSVFDEGSPYFHSKETTRTKMETTNLDMPVINSYEGEVLFPAGKTFHYTQDAQVGFFAQVVNSPAFVPSGGHWSSTALAEAFRNHLSKAYKDSGHQTTVAGVTITRPNHGLAHVHRVMVYLDVIIDYFAHHAKEEPFKLFCQNLQPSEREWLRVAAAYSITGRESEIAAKEDLEHYDQFRQASVEHMEAFLMIYPPPTEDKAMRERMLDIVRWMGNPAYEQPLNGKEAINANTNLEERAHRTFLHRILSVAHKLDLPRCYEPGQLSQAMEFCLTLSENSPEQTADYARMMGYAIDLIRAHGNQLNTQLAPDGEYLSCHESYRPPFDKASSNLRQLYELTDTVARPRLQEPYQFNPIQT